MMAKMRSSSPILLVGLAVAFLTSGCGSSGGSHANAAEQKAAAVKTAAAMKTRLRKAGYVVQTNSFNSGAKPRPQQAFKIDANFPNANSFEFDVYVYRTPSQASVAAKAAGVSNEAYGAQARVEAIGPVLYSGSTAPTSSAGGNLPLPQYNHLVAVARGT
jgi:hypothetical protein